MDRTPVNRLRASGVGWLAPVKHSVAPGEVPFGPSPPPIGPSEVGAAENQDCPSPALRPGSVRAGSCRSTPVFRSRSLHRPSAHRDHRSITNRSTFGPHPRPAARALMAHRTDPLSCSPMLFPQFRHLWHVPLRTVIVPHTSHGGASLVLSMATESVEACVCVATSSTFPVAPPPTDPRPLDHIHLLRRHAKSTSSLRVRVHPRLRPSLILHAECRAPRPSAPPTTSRPIRASARSARDTPR
jgi:hypothetical protein